MTAGRFAPSPTGPLHMGSLITALASYLAAKQAGLRWQVRIDDIDPPRSQPGATQQIIHSLARHGLTPDDPVTFQSDHQQDYQAALRALAEDCFYCRCSRQSLKSFAVYPGTCRAYKQERPDSAMRLRVRGDLAINDGLLGAHEFQLDREFGDTIIRRRDGLVAYQLATAVDDGAANISQVLRGQDLWPTTPLQRYIMAKLALAPPQYTHIPVLCYPDGIKLSKQTQAPALDDNQASNNLSHAMNYLGLQPPQNVDFTVEQWISWGLEHWSLDKVPAVLAPYQRAADA